MTDVARVLTETLREHRKTNIEQLRTGDYRIICDGCSWRSDEYSAVEACDAHDAHLADVLLGLSGVAVTQLPEPDWRKPADDDENGAAAWEYPDGEVVVYDDGSYEWRAFGINSDDPSRLRDGAAALLAAGVFSEEHQK